MGLLEGPGRPGEDEAIREVLQAIAAGPFLEDWEFQTVMGAPRDAVARLATTWPGTGGLSRSEGWAAVNNAIVNLLGYPHGRDLGKYVSATKSELDSLLGRVQERASQ